MPYVPNRTTPDWTSILADLAETLREWQIDLATSVRNGVEPHITALTVLDQISTYMSALSRDLGV